MESVNNSLENLKKLADDNMDLTYTFAAVGLGYVGIKTAKALYSCYRYLLRPSKDLKKRYGNNWAVVTGASDGIGKALCFELAKRGFRIALLGRNAEKLQAVVNDLKINYPTLEYRTYVFDFNTHYTEEKIQELSDLVQDLEKVSILVNNVGTASYDPLVKMSDPDIHKQINVNVVGTTVFSKIMIPKLLANETRSAMINIASSVYEAPSPNLAVYSASKAYVHQLSLSLAEEHADKIDVMATRTSGVKTNMNSGRYLFTITTEQHAKAVLSEIGYQNETHGHWIHAWRAHCMQKTFESSIINYINRKRKEEFVRERDAQRQAQENQ